MERSKQFYKDVLGLHIIADYGENVVLTGGFSLQECALWCEFIYDREENIIFLYNNYKRACGNEIAASSFSVN